MYKIQPKSTMNTNFNIVRVNALETKNSPDFWKRREQNRNTITKFSNKQAKMSTIILHFIKCTTTNLTQYSKDKSNPQKILFCFSTH